MDSKIVKTLQAVTVSVTYHRNCFVVVDGFEDLEEAVRQQVRMPGDPMLDPSEWSEDELAVIPYDHTLKLVTIPEHHTKEQR